LQRARQDIVVARVEVRRDIVAIVIVVIMEDDRLLFLGIGVKAREDMGHSLRRLATMRRPELAMFLGLRDSSIGLGWPCV
jgi:hypothetical protein